MKRFSKAQRLEQWTVKDYILAVRYQQEYENWDKACQLLYECTEKFFPGDEPEKGIY